MCEIISIVQPVRLFIVTSKEEDAQFCYIVDYKSLVPTVPKTCVKSPNCQFCLPGTDLSPKLDLTQIMTRG